MMDRRNLRQLLKEEDVKRQAKLAARRKHVEEVYDNEERYFDDDISPDNFEPEENVVSVDHSRLVEKKGTGIQIVLETSVPTYFIKGKQMTPESAYQTAHMEALVGACFAYYMENGGDSPDGSVEAFTAIAMQLLATSGTAIPKLDKLAVLASVKHIKREGITPYKAMRDTAEAVKRNAPRAAIADAGSVGAASHIVDQSTGKVYVPSHPSLEVNATKALGSLGVVHIPPLTKSVDIVIQTLGGFNVEAEKLTTQLRDMTVDELPNVREPNVLRPFIKTPGVMTDGVLPRGIEGHYVQIHRLLKMVENEPPALLFVPEASIVSNSVYDVEDELSAIIAVPKYSEMNMASPSLMATVIPYSEVKDKIMTAEKLCRDDPDFKGENARDIAHGEFGNEYARYRANGHGVVKQDGLRYVSLYRKEAITSDELLHANAEGELNDRVALVRAGDYNKARKDGLAYGSFIWIDLPAMMGLFFSRNYIATYVRPGCKTEDNKLKHMKGYMVMRNVPTSSMPSYMNWLCRYMFAHCAITRMDGTPKMRDAYLKHYLDTYGNGMPAPVSIFDDCKWVYDEVQPIMKMVMVRYAAYSMTKIAKYGTLMPDMLEGLGYGDDSREMRISKIDVKKSPDGDDPGADGPDGDVDLDDVDIGSMYGST